MHLDALKCQQVRLGGGEALADDDDGNTKKKSRKSKGGETLKGESAERDVAGGGGGGAWEGGGRVGGGDVTLAALWVLREHLAADKARAVVLAILGLDLQCKHTQELVDRYCGVAAGIIRALSERGASFTCHRTIQRLLATCGQVQPLPHRSLCLSLIVYGACACACACG